METAGGQIQGYTSNSVDKWRGIPYAAPPVGDLRFRVPQPGMTWEGIKSGLVAGPICPQLYGLIPGQWSGEEDCLYADIYAPADRDLSTPLPVFVWVREHCGASIQCGTHCLTSCILAIAFGLNLLFFFVDRLFCVVCRSMAVVGSLAMASNLDCTMPITLQTFIRSLW